MAEFNYPSVPAVAKEFDSFVNRGVELKLQIDVLKSDLKELANDAKDRFDVPTGVFNKYVTAQYDKDKFIENLEEMESIADDLEIR